MKITAVTCVKNEGPFLLEWIAFNRVIGVTDFLIYSNDCTDATDRMLDRLEELGLVTHLPNPAEGRNYQMEALKDARSQPVVHEADWVWIADVDEFLNIHVGDGTIPRADRGLRRPRRRSRVTFQFFANDGIERFEDRPVIEQFTRSHDPDIWCAETAQEVKTLIRKDFPVKYYGAHRPFMKDRFVKEKASAGPTARGATCPGGSGSRPPSGGCASFPPRARATSPRSTTTRCARSTATWSRTTAATSTARTAVSTTPIGASATTRPGKTPRSTATCRGCKTELARLKDDLHLAALHEEAVWAHRDARDRLMAEPDYRRARDAPESAAHTRARPSWR